jgi:hyperosmotically inducible protein
LNGLGFEAIQNGSVWRLLMHVRGSSVCNIVVIVVIGLFIIASGTASAAQPPPGQKPTTQPRTESKGNPVTDAWITMKIHSQFIPENALEDSNIDVDTQNGVVTLTGTVASAAGRTRAVEIAKATDGVKNVNDKLRVAPEGGRDPVAAAKDTTKTAGRRVNDGWIKSKIYAQFLTEDSLTDSDIDIDVAQGMVALNGTVKSEAGRTRAVAIAKATDGVKNVKDALKVMK